MLSCRIDGVLRRMSATGPRSILGAGLLLLLASASLLSQGNVGRILGTVTDQTGAPVPGVTVTIIDVRPRRRAHSYHRYLGRIQRP